MQDSVAACLTRQLRKCEKQHSSRTAQHAAAKQLLTTAGARKLLKDAKS